MTEQPETQTSQDLPQEVVDEVPSQTGTPVDGDATSDEREPAYEDEQGSDETGDQSSPDDVTDDAGSLGDEAPETGDLVIDAALRDLAEAPADDLDAQIERGEQVQRTLQGRLSDLGG